MDGTPLVSVIIPCYNQGHFLSSAIESVCAQTYPAIEILVVDDGSTDDTRAVTASFPSATYVYQPNQGLSAARNTGIRRSKGTYLVFLDADDWLYAQAIGTNVTHLQHHPEAAFVTGSHDLVYPDRASESQILGISASPYLTLLAKGNYIGMIAAVMFQRWALTELLFDSALRRCEDYDLYLKLTRHYPIAQHQEKLAAYRIHSLSLSASTMSMLESALTVLGNQKASIRNPAEAQALKDGLDYWKTYYFSVLCFGQTANPATWDWHVRKKLLAYSPRMFIRYYLLPHGMSFTAKLKNYMPKAGFKILRRLGLIDHSQPPIGKVEWGDLARETPLCPDFGYNRGGPIDRYYIENFLTAESSSIRGRVLEIGDNSYTLQFGKQQVTHSDVLYVDASNPHATLIGDLSDAPQLSSNTFDCLILTQTLHLIYNFQEAIATCFRILKPGGVLLLTTPGITPIDRGEWQDTWYWAFTDKALRRMLSAHFAPHQVHIRSFGNVQVAAAFLYGLGLSEISRHRLDYYDPQFQVINAVKAIKSLPSV